MSLEEHREPAPSDAISRRRALQLGVAGLGALSVGSLMACGDDDTATTTGGTTSSAAAPKAPTGQLPAFDPSAPAGKASNLPKRVAFANPFDAPLFIQVGTSLKEAAESRGVEYLTAISNGDPAKMTQQIEGFLARGIGVLFVSPVEEEATRPLLQRAIEADIAVFGVQRPYAHLQVAQNETEIGAQQGRAAVKWIEENLDGKAEVAYFNEDNSASIIPRHQAVLAELKKGGAGIKVVSDTQAPLETEAGANAMNTILQAHPGVNVVMGGSGVIGGVFAAYDAKGKGKAKDVYLSSIAGDDAALAQIASGNSAYKATFAQAWQLYAYALGQYAADWMEGKSIPQGVTSPGGLAEISSADVVAEWKRDMGDLPATWKNKREQYLKLEGNIRFEDRASYWKEVWTP